MSGELIYKSLFSYDAEIVLPNVEAYIVSVKGLFSTNIALSKSGVEVANLQMNWKGHIIMTFIEGRQYICKAKGILQNHYVIEDEKGAKLVHYEPEFHWKKLHYHYDITYANEVKDPILLLLGVYASNYYLSAMSEEM